MISKPFIPLITVVTLIIYYYSKFVNALQPISLIGPWCQADSKFNSSGSSYKKDLDILLSSLSSKATQSSTNGYFTTNTTALGSASVSERSETIYGTFLCRGDIIPESCKDCVAFAVAKAQSDEGCPNYKTAVIWCDLCMVRYSNTSIISTATENDFLPWFNKKPVNHEIMKFIKLVGSTLNDLAEQVVLPANYQRKTGAKKYFGVKGPVPFDPYTNLYTMAQCSPDLDPTTCGICLGWAINQMSDSCNGTKGCQMFFLSCYTRYEVYPFAENNTVSPAPLQLPPSLNSTVSTNPPSTTGKKTRQPQAVNIALGVLVGVVLLLVMLLFLLFARLKSKDGEGIEIHRRPSYAPTSEPAEHLVTTESLQCDFETLQIATNNFSDDNKLGEGGFGSVYKGYLQNGKAVAVKRLSRDSSQGAEQFKNEVLFVAKLQHRNLVRLLGYCLTTEEKLLVYEFVPRKSLDLILFDPNIQEQLDWATRYRIIKGIARGILYLHEDSRLKIVHRDLKASNILLDDDMNPKISDFGLARNFELNQKQDITHRVAGTLGYMAPEYLEYGEFSVQSDVYSFGVLVLEIISGRKINNRPISGSAENLLNFAWKYWNEDKPQEFVDPLVGDSYSSNEVIRCMHIGLLCVQRRIEDRPSMISVVLYLNSNIVLPMPQQPVFFTSSGNESRSGSSRQFSVGSHKTGSSARSTEVLSAKSTSKSTHSFPGTEG